ADAVGEFAHARLDRIDAAAQLPQRCTRGVQDQRDTHRAGEIRELLIEVDRRARWQAAAGDEMGCADRDRTPAARTSSSRNRPVCPPAGNTAVASTSSARMVRATLIPPPPGSNRGAAQRIFSVGS